ncbi:Putative disease resistance RPP13-like protein [Arachis hypogaea]|nr:Putative disease resistance RPP13-like protein [Arachis hypogaea]
MDNRATSREGGSSGSEGKKRACGGVDGPAMAPRLDGGWREAMTGKVEALCSASVVFECCECERLGWGGRSGATSRGRPARGGDREVEESSAFAVCYLSSYVDAVLNKLSSLDVNSTPEAKKLADQKLFQRLKASLRATRPVLDDAEQKQIRDQEVNKWLVDLQDALYMADDLLDELSTKAVTATPTQRDPGNSSSWSHSVDSILEDGDDDEMGVVTRMQDIVDKLESIVEEKDDLDLKQGVAKDLEDMSWRIQSSLLESPDIYGRNDDKEAIIKLLLDETCDDKLSVISIEGIGGIGKTTLAQWVYNDVRLKDKFTINAWVCVAIKFDPVNVTKAIIEDIASSPCNMVNLNSIQTELKEKLTGKTFLVVLDDVWDNQQNFKDKVEDWENILRSEIWELPEDESKIVAALRVSYHYLPSNLKRADAGLFVMHDLMHDLATSATSFAAKFFFRVDKFGNPHMADSKTRHLSYNRGRISKFPEAYNGAIYMRTFLPIDVQSNDIESELIHLRYLDLSETPIVTLPESLCRLYHLQTLKLRDCEKLEMLPSRMQDLVNLRHLDIRGAYRLEEMPKGMNLKDSGEALEAKMGNKKHINILELKWISDDDDGKDDDVDFQKERNILEELQPHRNLKEYQLMVIGLPSLGQLPSLQHLLIWGVDGLERIGDCPVLSGDLPADLPALEKLTIRNCEELACSLPRAPKLHQLNVMGSGRFWYGYAAPHDVVIKNTQLVMSILEWLPHFQSPCLERLKIHKCSSAISISGDYLPDSLQFLKISGCSNLTISEPLQHKSLTEIIVFGCDSLTMFPLGALPNLKTLYISSCRRLVSVPALGFAAPHLDILEIHECPEMDCFGEECLPPSLTTLGIRRCQKLERWITWRGLQSEGLTRLLLHRWNEVKWFPREGCLPASLQYLHLSSFSNLETLDCRGLHQLTSLKQLKIENCPKLENITQQNLPASISKLRIKGECPLGSNLEEMNDPRIQSQTTQIMIQTHES